MARSLRCIQHDRISRGLSGKWVGKVEEFDAATE